MKPAITLTKALRLAHIPPPSVAFVGAGGKTSALFQTARELAPCIVTTTTHLGAWQAAEADQHIVFHKEDFIQNYVVHFGYAQKNIVLVTGKEKNKRLTSPEEKEMAWLAAYCKSHSLPLLIEADGARGAPLKTPKAHEPVIPDFIDTVVVVAGLSGLGKALDEKNVYNAGDFAKHSNLKIGEKITAAHLAKVLTHPKSGLKGIPEHAHRIALLNQADTALLQSRGKNIAASLLLQFDTVIVTSLQKNIFSLHEKTAAIILAAGGSKRYGQSKQLLDYHGESFVRRIAKTAIQAGLDPVIVVTGAENEKIAKALAKLPVEIAHNPSWQEGQSASVKCGILALQKQPRQPGSAIFLLADQPQVTVSVLRALIEEHAATMHPVIAPMVEGQRANPVLWDRLTFPDLLKLEGDVGGRGIFSKFPPKYMHWNDSRLLLDVDTPEAYQKLIKR